MPCGRWLPKLTKKCKTFCTNFLWVVFLIFCELHTPKLRATLLHLSAFIFHFVHQGVPNILKVMPSGSWLLRKPYILAHFYFCLHWIISPEFLEVHITNLFTKRKQEASSFTFKLFLKDISITSEVRRPGKWLLKNAQKLGHFCVNVKWPISLVFSKLLMVNLLMTGKWNIFFFILKLFCQDKCIISEV